MIYYLFIGTFNMEIANVFCLISLNECIPNKVIVLDMNFGGKKST